ncbi:MAG: aminotransferase class III-fold pyridoxal phosphate-dependent enzyme [Candidatus Latescibacterota bacterium]
MADPKKHSVQRSLKDYARAEQLIAGGTQLISRRPSRMAYGVSPIYADHAKGSHFWDVDGNEYVDWVSGILAIILGYADEVVDNAVKEQIGKGVNFSINNELELELAEELIRTIPSAEMVRYAKGGGDACTVAVRIARGTTGRDKVLFCGYHGWHDWYLAANLLKDATLDEHLFPGIDPTGVPKALAGTIFPFRYGDLDMLEQLLQSNKGEVACIIMEPLRSELPPEGYLEGVRALADRFGVVLIFDEVSCGFRIALGGAQEYLGITPDLTVIAKAMSNGYPMGAVVGKREVMEPASRMFISSTYWSDTIGMVAALTTIRELRRRGSTEHFAKAGRTIKQALGEAIRETGIPAHVSGLDCSPKFLFDIADPKLLQKVSTLYVQEMSKRGIFCSSYFTLNMAHSADDIAQTVATSREVFGLICSALEKGNIEDFLEAELKTDTFRRMVS